MTSPTFQVNTFGGGMNTDADLSLMKSHQYLYAENVRIIGDASNSSGVLLSSSIAVVISDDILLAGEKVIGISTMSNTSILFTKSGNAGDVTNRVIRIDFNDDCTIKSSLVIMNGKYGLETDISIVFNKEDISIEKVYFADGISMIRILDVTKPVPTGFKITDLDIIPDSSLESPIISGIASGALKAGKYQYSYQLFNSNGAGTEMSSLSELVSIANANITDEISLGDVSSITTNKGIVIKIDKLDKKYKVCRLYQIYYASNTALPKISVIKEFNISNSNTQLITADGSDALNEITIQEYNGIVGANFIPTILERLDNRLFAANIKDNTWDIPDSYDTRAFCCNRNGDVLLKSNTDADITFNIANIATAVIPKDHDCINPDLYKTVSLFTDSYAYMSKATGTGTGIKDGVLGGIGKNISYKFTAITLEGESKTDMDKFYGTTATDVDGTPIDVPGGQTTFNPTFNVLAHGANSYVTANVKDIKEGTFTEIVPKENMLRTNGKWNFSSTKFQMFDNTIKGKLNYSNPLIADRFRGYRRGEIYRFGIVFYNKKGSASPVHWIADIKFPTQERFPIFTTWQSLNPKTSNFTEELLLHALGIQFTVNTLPEGAVRYEIVRCQRTLQDSTILMQAATSKCLLQKKDTNVIYPLAYLSMCNHDDALWVAYSLSVYDAFYNLSTERLSKLSGNYSVLISPEINYNKDGIKKLVNNSMYLQSVCALSSPIRIPNRNATPSPTVNITNLSQHRNDNSFYSTSLPYIFGETHYNLFSTHYPNKTTFILQSAGVDIDTPDVHNMVHVSKYFTKSNYIGLKGTELSDTAPLYLQTFDILNVEYPKMFTWSTPKEDLLANATSIGEASYINWATTKVLRDDNQDPLLNTSNIYPMGPHGYCLVVNTDKTMELCNAGNGTNPSSMDGKQIQTLPVLDSANQPELTANNGFDTNSIRIVNIKQNVSQYGGNSFTARTNSVYIATGKHYSTVESNIYKSVVFGGDTYIGLFDYASMMMYETKDPLLEPMQKKYIGAYIPMESSINFEFKQDLSIKDSKVLSSIKYVQPVAGQMSDKYTQTIPMCAYDDAYSAQATVKKFVARPKDDKLNKKIGNRITNSLAKTNGELIDNWCRFQPLDYIDVDNRHGDITNLKVFNNKLYYWQVNAFGVASVNERSLIKDNNVSALTLGTAGVLSRYDYVSTTYGNGILNDKSIINTDNTIYWYDFDKNEIMGYGGSQLHNLSKVKSVQGLLNDHRAIDKTKPVSFYDLKHNEVGFVTDGSGALIFNEALGVFTGVNTLAIPSDVIKLSNSLVTISNNKIVGFDCSGKSTVSDNIVSKMQFVINNDYEYTKTFDNAFLNGDFTGNTGSRITKVSFTTPNQESEVLDATNISNREGTYGFNIPRAKCAAGDYPERLRGKRLVCNYEFTASNKAKFRVPQIRTTYRYSLI